MRSIRLSLLVCFLGLLTLALTAAAVLAYRTSHQTLEAKKKATADLLEAQYKERCREEEKRLEKSLLDQAQTLASLSVFSRDDRLHGYGQFHWLGILSAGMSPSGYALVPVWLAEGEETPIAAEMRRRQRINWRFFFNPLRFTNRESLDHLEGPVGEFFQIDVDRGPRYRSKSLEDRTLPLDPAGFAVEQDYYYQYSDIDLEPGLTVHRIIFKTVLSHFAGRSGPRPRPPFITDPRPPSGDLTRSQAVYIQCAFDVTDLRATMAGFVERRDQELKELATESDAALTALRNRLLLIATATLFAAAVISFWIVHLGLAPLRKLSDAVSRVSPKHLQLPFAERNLPAELQPIVGRLTETLDQLRRAFEREKQATADISHELRTPLAALLTTTELALRKPRSADDYRELLEDCRLSAQQMNHMVDRLLTLARLDAGVDHLRPQTVDAAALAEQCAAVVRPLAEARNLTLHVHRNGVTPLTTDPDKLREVMSNLLHNAIQYNRPDGSVDLSVVLSEGRLQVEVADTGVGIAPEACAHIFERFYRADPSRGGDGLHSGLGLAIVKEYVDLMGGSIAVESTVGLGSTFRISLPATGQAA